MLRGLNTTGARKLPAEAPTAFISKRWQKLVLTEEGLDRRQFKDFEDYLVPADRFAALR